MTTPSTAYLVSTEWEFDRVLTTRAEAAEFLADAYDMGRIGCSVVCVEWDNKDVAIQCLLDCAAWPLCAIRLRDEERATERLFYETA